MAATDAQLEEIATNIAEMFIKIRASGSDTMRVLGLVLAIYFVGQDADEQYIEEMLGELREMVKRTMDQPILPVN